MKKSSLKDLVIRSWIAKKVKEEVAAEFTAAQGEAIDAFHADGVQTISVDYDGTLVTGTLVEVTRAVLDEAALIERLTKKQWEQISVRKLDKDLLEAYVKTGQIDAEMVESCMELKDNAPFVKFTSKEGAAAVAPARKKVRR